jgi:hypothetical protein
MPISLIDEQENHFTLHDGNESFPVAKFGLDDTTMGQIRSLPQGYADGGFVMPTEQENMMFAAPSNPATLLGGNVKLEDVGPAIAPYEGINFMTPEQQSTLGANFPRADAATGTGLGLMGPSMNFEQPSEIQASAPAPAQTGLPGYLAQTQQFMQPQQQAPAGLPSDYTKAFNEIQQGTMAQAQAHADAATQQAQVYEQQMKELRQNEIERKRQSDAAMADINKIQNDVMTQKIDPTRVWSNMSTGNRVLAGISIFLGGVAGGMQGTENRALGIIQDAVNKDIDAQKAEIGKKQNMLSLNMAKYNNIQDAANATKAQLLSITQAQINQAAAKMGSRQALAAAQVANGQIDLQKAALIQQIGASQAAAQKLNNPAGISPKDVQKLSQDMQDKLVQMPNGNFVPAFNKEAASKVREIQGSIYSVQNTLNEAKKFMDQGGTLPLSKRNTIAKTIEQRILTDLKSKAMLDLGALTKADIDLLEPLVPSVGDFFDAKSRAKIDQLQNMLTAKMNAHYSAYVPGLNPSGRQSRETSVFGK